MKTKLSTEERTIERRASEYRPVTGKKRERIHGILERTRKTKNINIRIAEATLEELKRRSEREGLPYQTLISSILHKYVTNRLVDQEALTKSIELLRSTR